MNNATHRPSSAVVHSLSRLPSLLSQVSATAPAQPDDAAIIQAAIDLCERKPDDVLFSRFLLGNLRKALASLG